MKKGFVRYAMTKDGFVKIILIKPGVTEKAVMAAIESLRTEGSRISPGFMRPEGIIIYHTAAGMSFKKTIEKDEVPKTMVKP